MTCQRTSLHTYFENIPDHRINRNLKHSLCDIIILSIWAVLCGAESWDSIETFGKTKYAFLKTFLRLPNPTFTSNIFEGESWDKKNGNALFEIDTS